MSTITPDYRTIQQLLQNQSFSIDEYQREYKWEKENIQELLADLQAKFLNHYRPGDETDEVGNYGEYFLGSIIVSKRNNKKYLIDGQQRVTSLTLLLISLYRAASVRGLHVKGTVAPLIYSDNLGKPKFNLDIPERLPVIQALFRGEQFTPDGQDESIQNMYDRYNDIEQSGLVDDLGEALPHFIYWLMAKVGLIEISTDNDNFAYAIFETMNDRGKPLSPVDMLKAYLLASITETDQKNMANNAWKNQVLELLRASGDREPERDSNCIKAWMRAQYAETIRDRRAGASDKDWELIGTVFHRWVRDQSQRLNLGNSGSNFRMMTVSFPFFARAYRKVQAASKKIEDGLEAVFYNAHNDFTWQSTVLLAPLVESDDDATVKRKMAVTATYLDIWIMRRTVNYIRVGYSNVNYAMWRLCNDIRRKPLQELVSILENRLKADEEEVAFTGSPSRGRRGLEGLGLNLFSRRYIFHLLARVTALVEQGAGRSVTFEQLVNRDVKNPMDIEHICSVNDEESRAEFQSEQEFDDWRNHVASLVLLPADVNRSLQDKSFADKKPSYANQNMYAASLDTSAYVHQPKFKKFMETHDLPFKPYNNFLKEEQNDRRMLLEALVNYIWSPDRIRKAADA